MATLPRGTVVEFFLVLTTIIRFHLTTDKAELKMSDNWNPSQEELPFVTFRSHVTRNEKEDDEMEPCK